MTDRNLSASISTLALILVLALVLTLSIPALVSAGDEYVHLSFDPEEAEATAGDTVTVDIVSEVRSDHLEEGVVSLELALRYDPDAIRVESVEPGPWLEAGDGERVSTDETVSHETGTVSIEQHQRPQEAGAIEPGVIATVEFEVADDIEPADVALEFEDVEMQLPATFLPVFDWPGTIVVDGGGEDRTPPAVDGEAETSDDGPGVTTAESDGEAEETERTETDSNGTVEQEDDTAGETERMPGFGPAVAVLALLAGLGLVGYRRTTNRS